jgi:hypothetical protein
MNELAILIDLSPPGADRQNTTASAKLNNSSGISVKLARFFGVKVTNRKPLM